MFTFLIKNKDTGAIYIAFHITGDNGSDITRMSRIIGPIRTHFSCLCYNPVTLLRRATSLAAYSF
jgi:hypothetical protein